MLILQNVVEAFLQQMRATMNVWLSLTRHWIKQLLLVTHT